MTSYYKYNKIRKYNISRDIKWCLLGKAYFT